MIAGDIIKTTVGKAEIIAINDFVEAPDAHEFFPKVTEHEWKILQEQYPERISEDLKLNPWTYFCYIVKVDGHVILVDSGVGGGERTGNTASLQWEGVLDKCLAKEGIREEDITEVLLTHIHGDHIGWNMKFKNGKYVKRFQNAKYYARKNDYDAYYQGLTKPAFADGLFEMCIESLVEMGDIQLVEEPEIRISESVTYENFPGHTPGLSCIIVQSEGEILILTGDCFASPIQISDTSLEFVWDIDKSKVKESRDRVLKKYGIVGAYLGAAHFGLGRIYLSNGKKCWRAYQ